MSARGKPMPSMFAIAASRSAPSANAEGSLNAVPPDDGAEGAGEGVTGAFVVVDAAGAGAAGGAVVLVDVEAGVEGALLTAEDAAGAAFGCSTVTDR